MEERIRVNTMKLQEFVTKILNFYGLSKEDAAISADVLITADKRGIGSHGVARLKRYVDGIRDGIINLNGSPKTIQETPVSLVIDGDAGMGQVVAYHTMKRCLQKARENYMCFASVRNSNHYGIAGYYTQMALDENMIGISLTNSAPLVVPTFGKDAVIGTNPISFGTPTKAERPFLLDMATATVPRGKVEVQARENNPMPDMWATDEEGIATTDAKRVLANLLERKGGGLLPLGGASKISGGHKGYDLGVLVDILCGVFSDGAVGSEVYGKKGQPAEVAHFLGVINPAAFTGLEAIQNKMDAYIKMIKDSEKAVNQDRIFIAGEPEFEAEELNRDLVSIQSKVFEILNEIGQEYNIEIKSV